MTLQKLQMKNGINSEGGVDVLCGGFPCQAFSIAGKRRGFADETRGTLFFEVARAAKEIQPSYLFLENVKGLLNHDKGRTFRTILSTLDECGYDVEWQLCNSKNFGVPQNRERVIIIGHLRGASTREIFFDAGQSGQTIGSNVIELAKKYPNRHSSESNSILSTEGNAHTLTAHAAKEQPHVDVKQVGNISDSDSFGGNPQTGRVYDPEGLSPTLNTMTGGGREPKVAVRETTTNVSQGVKVEAKPDFGRFGQQAVDTMNANEVSDFDIIEPFNHRVHKDQVSPTLTTRPEGLKTAILPVTNNLRIRKLTPLECWRLQGFPDWAFDKAQEVNSNSQLYKQAGNSVTVPLMEFVAKRLKVV